MPDGRMPLDQCHRPFFIATRLSLYLHIAAIWPALTCGLCAAAPPASKAVEKEGEHIRAVLQANFQACNEENLEALMATCSREPPGTEEFAEEAKKLFKDTDVYLRLADFELLELRPPFASARVIQITLPANEKDRQTGDARQVFFRGNSALLPQWETCEYTQTFKKEGGKWKLYAITTKPTPAVWPPDNPNAIRTDDMPALEPRTSPVFK